MGETGTVEAEGVVGDGEAVPAAGGGGKWGWLAGVRAVLQLKHRASAAPR